MPNDPGRAWHLHQGCQIPKLDSHGSPWASGGCDLSRRWRMNAQDPPWHGLTLGCAAHPASLANLLWLSCRRWSCKRLVSTDCASYIAFSISSAMGHFPFCVLGQQSFNISKTRIHTVNLTVNAHMEIITWCPIPTDTCLHAK